MQMVTSRKANAHILYDAQTAPQTGSAGLLPEHFTEDWWTQRQAVVGRAPGRGESLFLRPAQAGTDSSPGDEQWVLRHYRRGGAAARLSEKHYFWLSLARNRAFAECRLLAGLHRRGLPVPAPIGACAWREGPLGLYYRAALITRRIAGARALAALLEAAPLKPAGPTVATYPEPEKDPGKNREQALAPAPESSPGPDLEETLEACGAMIRRFHRAGLDHVDLNARNILIDNRGGPWLIDLDRCRLRSPGRWQRSNLARLERSLEKFAPGQAATLMPLVINGYGSS